MLPRARVCASETAVHVTIQLQSLIIILNLYYQLEQPLHRASRLRVIVCSPKVINDYRMPVRYEPAAHSR